MGRQRNLQSIASSDLHLKIKSKKHVVSQCLSPWRHHCERTDFPLHQSSPVLDQSHSSRGKYHLLHPRQVKRWQWVIDKAWRSGLDFWGWRPCSAVRSQLKSNLLEQKESNGHQWQPLPIYRTRKSDRGTIKKLLSQLENSHACASTDNSLGLAVGYINVA